MILTPGMYIPTKPTPHIPLSTMAIIIFSVIIGNKICVIIERIADPKKTGFGPTRSVNGIMNSADIRYPARYAE